MLLPADGTDYSPEVDYNDMFSTHQSTPAPALPEIPQQIPQLNSPSTNASTGNLYEHLMASPALSTTAQAPSSPLMMFPYSPVAGLAGGSPSCLMTNEPAWMHSTRTRRRRAPQHVMMSPLSPALSHVTPGLFTHSPPMQMAPAHVHPYYYAPPTHHPAPMNVTVKLPMAPLTPTNQASQPKSSSSAAIGVKVPLMLPSHFCNPSAAPNSSAHSSHVPSRSSSVTPGSSVSNTSSGSGWFSAMTATKDSFLQEASGIDFQNVTVLEMKQLLRRFGLNSTGKKVQLMERIREIETFLRQERVK